MIEDSMFFAPQDSLVPRMEQVRVMCKELKEYEVDTFAAQAITQAIILLLDSCSLEHNNPTGAMH